MSIENITASLWQELSARTPPPNTTTRFCSSSGFIYQIHLKKILYVSVECNGMKPLTTERPLRPMVHRISCVVYKKGVMLFSAGTDVICVCKPEGRFISCFLFSPGVTMKCLQRASPQTTNPSPTLSSRPLCPQHEQHRLSHMFSLNTRFHHLNMSSCFSDPLFIVSVQRILVLNMFSVRST